MVFWEEILTQIFGEKQTFQDNGPQLVANLLVHLQSFGKTSLQMIKL